jgi:type II secretory pathway predicted ATPase ExeA
LTTSTKTAGPKDSRSRFGFHTAPFSREILIDRRFVVDFFEEAVKSLETAVLQRESAALIAPAGSGKTLVLRALAERLPEARFRVRYVKVTNLSRRDMCREISYAMDVPAAGQLPTLVRNLQERLRAVESDGLRPVLLLDEAHDMRPETLGLLEIVTNFDMDSRLVVSVVLAGQPPLSRTLQRPEMEGVARRLVHFATLRPLSREETSAYVEHRCAVAGNVTPPFDPQALEAIYEISRGNLRAIDRLAGKALEIAAQKGEDVVGAPHLIQARKVLWP